MNANFELINQELTSLRVDSVHRTKLKLNPFEAQYEAKVSFNGHQSFSAYRRHLDDLYFGFIGKLHTELGVIDPLDAIIILDQYHILIRDLKRRGLPSHVDFILFELKMQGFSAYYRDTHSLEDIKKKS